MTTEHRPGDDQVPSATTVEPDSDPAPATTGDPLADDTTLARTGQSVVTRWRLTLVLFVVFSAIGIALVWLQPATYQSTAVLAFQPSDNQAVGADLVTLLAERYPELVSSQEAIDAAAAAAGVTPSQVRSGLSAAITPLTLNLVVSVRLPTAQQAQDATASLVRQVIAEDARDPFLTALTVASPSLPDNPAGLPKTLLYGLAVVTAAILSVLVVVIWSALRGGWQRLLRTS